jgi:hypothetical protein
MLVFSGSLASTSLGSPSAAAAEMADVVGIDGDTLFDS